MTDEPDAAVLWYEASIKHGLKNPAILNNLSVSLLLQTKPKSLVKRIALAKSVLEEALQLNPNSVVIRMNALLLDLRRLESDAEANMEAAVKHANWLCKKNPNHSQVLEKTYKLFFALAEHKRVDNNKVEIALKRSRNSSVGTPIPIFLDPLYADEND